MFRLHGRPLRHLFSLRSASFRRLFTPSDSQPPDPNDKLEEESLPEYLQDRFYPVKIGETFQTRYQVIGKLGFGVCSTVWLCKDLTYVLLMLRTIESRIDIVQTAQVCHFEGLWARLA
jgi:hypothetical protein